MHGDLYGEEFHFGPEFEKYVAEGLDEFLAQYDATMDRVWTARSNNQLAGFILIMHRGNNSAQLRYFFVDPKHRGKGLGIRLMELFMQFVDEKSYDSVYLWTTSELETAAALYKRFGFVLTESVTTTNFGKEVVEQRYEWKAKK